MAGAGAHTESALEIQGTSSVENNFACTNGCRV